uniref:Uncharacterized protein n=1 Tax=Zooxanthella nutricula TaxID=1333877 RepID=A0A7S2LZE1_9DINO
MLNYRQPTLFELDKAMEIYSSKRRQPVYSISKTERFPPPRSGSAYSFPPGHYKIDCTFPIDRQTELSASKITRSISAPRFSFKREKRVHTDEFLKGISPMYGKDISNLGPGQYPLPKMGSRTYKGTAPSYSI